VLLRKGNYANERESKNVTACEGVSYGLYVFVFELWPGIVMVERDTKNSKHLFCFRVTSRTEYSNASTFGCVFFFLDVMYPPQRPQVRTIPVDFLRIRHPPPR